MGIKSEHAWQETSCLSSVFGDCALWIEAIAHSGASVYVPSMRAIRIGCRTGLIAAAALMFAVPQIAQARIGIVKVAVGTCLVLRGGRQIPVTVGLRLDKGDRVVTGSNGRIGITFEDNSRASIGPKSQIDFTEFAYSATTRQGRFVTNVSRGALVFVSGEIARSDRNAMRVRTPQRLLGVIGTRFLVVVE